MPFATVTVNVNGIHCEIIETEIQKYRKRVTSKKAEAVFYKSQWKREQKSMTGQISEKRQFDQDTDRGTVLN